MIDSASINLGHYKPSLIVIKDVRVIPGQEIVSVETDDIHSIMVEGPGRWLGCIYIWQAKKIPLYHLIVTLPDS